MYFSSWLQRRMCEIYLEMEGVPVAMQTFTE